MVPQDALDMKVCDLLEREDRNLFEALNEMNALKGDAREMSLPRKQRNSRPLKKPKFQN